MKTNTISATQINELDSNILFRKETYLSLKVYSPTPTDEWMPNPIKHVKIWTQELKSEYVPYCVAPNNRVNIGVVKNAIPCSKRVLEIFKRVILFALYFGSNFFCITLFHFNNPLGQAILCSSIFVTLWPNFAMRLWNPIACLVRRSIIVIRMPLPFLGSHFPSEVLTIAFLKLGSPSCNRNHFGLLHCAGILHRTGKPTWIYTPWIHCILRQGYGGFCPPQDEDVQSSSWIQTDNVNSL